MAVIGSYPIHKRLEIYRFIHEIYNNFRNLIKAKGHSQAMSAKNDFITKDEMEGSDWASEKSTVRTEIREDPDFRPHR